MLSFLLICEIRVVSNHLCLDILLQSATLFLSVFCRKLIESELHSSGIPYSWVCQHFCNFMFFQSRSEKLFLEDVADIK